MVSRLQSTTKINKSADKIDYSYTKTKDKNKKTFKGKWQLRIRYKITADEIVFDPYLVVTGTGFDENKTVTLRYSYQKLVSKSTDYGFSANKWETKNSSVSIKVKDEGIYYFFKNEKSLKTYQIIFTAKIGSKSSKAGLFGSQKPPRPELPVHDTVTYGLEHDPNGDVSLWTIHFAYVPKGGSNDYAAPVDSWHIYRMTDTTQSSWPEVYHKNTKHDVNGFRDLYQDHANVSATNQRIKWKVRFKNSNGLGDARVYPPNKENNVITQNRVKVISQIDKLKEWAYMPPAQISNIDVHRNTTNVRISWERGGEEVSKGYYRGYFLQYRANADIDKAASVKSIWAQKKIHRSLTKSSRGTVTDKNWKHYIEEDIKAANEYERQISCFALCSTNARYQFRLVPFNFDLGFRPDNITFNGARVQKAAPSDVSTIVYFVPAAPDSVKAVPAGSTEQYYYKVSVNFKKAQNRSVNSVIIERRYKYEDNTTSDWIRCEDPDGSTGIIPDTGLYLNRKGYGTESSRKAVFEYNDPQELPDIYGPDRKAVTMIQYRARLGAVKENEPDGDGEFPDTAVAFSKNTVMTNWIDRFKKPSVPTIISPELNKIYPEDTALVRLAWTHNPTDGTDQSKAILNIFVFADEVSVPDDFLTAWRIESRFTNSVTVTGNSSYYDMLITNDEDDESIDPITVYKITGLDEDTKTVTSFAQASFSANDRILWRVQTYGGSSTLPSDFTTEQRIFSLLARPEITITVTNLENNVLTRLPARITWEYSDLSGTIQSLNLYLTQGTQILESYAVDLDEESNYSFTYLFDNNSNYTLIAEATSSTTLTANAAISFDVNYTPVMLRDQLSIGAEFVESTGFVFITLTEESNDGSEDDATDISLPDGPTVKEVTGTNFEINRSYEYDSTTGKLVVKILLDKAISDICIASATSPLNETDFYPADSRFPGEDVYPNNVIRTNDTDLEYVIFDEETDDVPLYIFLSVPEDKGVIKIGETYGSTPSEDGTTPIYGRSILVQFDYTTGYSDIPFPIIGVLYDELDEVDEIRDGMIYVDEPAESVYLYRVYRGVKSYIGSFNPDFTDEETTAATIIDRFCPINREFTYQLVQVTSSGEVSFSEISYQFDTLYWYCYWGPSYDNVVKARWNPTGSANYSRPERQSVRYSGRNYPVVYDSDAIDETYSFSIELFEDDYMLDKLGDEETALETIELYRQLMFDGGVGFWKSFEGDVYFATFDFNYSIDFTDNIKKYPCSLSVTRIEGEEVF